jgi:hypothetical protein
MAKEQTNEHSLNRLRLESKLNRRSGGAQKASKENDRIGKQETEPRRQFNLSCPGTMQWDRSPWAYFFFGSVLLAMYVSTK